MAKLGKRTKAARETFAGKANLTVEDAVKLVKTAAPTVAADRLGTVDLVVLSHDQHPDNLDRAGRELLGHRGDPDDDDPVAPPLLGELDEPGPLDGSIVLDEDDDRRSTRVRGLIAPCAGSHEALELLQSFGAEESGLDQLARQGFHTLGLQTYLTAGPKESRAWTIGKGWTAPQAAGVIHTDFQRGFIKAEVVSFDDLVAAGSMNAAKAAGKVRIEGKEYVMNDGDVVEFRFNV